MLENGKIELPKWSRMVLVAAGIYNILWGAMVVLFPTLLWDKLQIEPPNYIELWQCIGLIIGGYGIGYLITSFNPVRYWPLILIGFIGKVLGPFGFVYAFYQGHLPIGFGWTILFTDVIWWIPFGIILYQIYKQYVLEPLPLEEELMLEQDFQFVETNKGWTLEEISERWPVVLVFLRHFGCTFCKETLADLAAYRKTLEENNRKLVLVHMAEEAEAEEILRNNGLAEVHHIADENRTLYRYFGLRRGFIHQLAGPKVWFRGIYAHFVKGHKLENPVNDPWQMPGVFLYHKGRIKKKFIHRSAADRPDYMSFVYADVTASQKRNPQQASSYQFNKSS